MWFRDAIFRNWAYLKIFIEPKLQLKSSIRRKSIEKPIANIHYWIYSILGIGAFATYIVNNPRNNMSLVIMISLFIITLTLDIYYRFWSGNVYKYYEEYFTKTLSEIGEESTSCQSVADNCDN